MRPSVPADRVTWSGERSRPPDSLSADPGRVCPPCLPHAGKAFETLPFASPAAERGGCPGGTQPLALGCPVAARGAPPAFQVAGLVTLQMTREAQVCLHLGTHEPAARPWITDLRHLGVQGSCTEAVSVPAGAPTSRDDLCPPVCVKSLSLQPAGLALQGLRGLFFFFPQGQIPRGRNLSAAGITLAFRSFCSSDIPALFLHPRFTTCESF